MRVKIIGLTLGIILTIVALLLFPWPISISKSQSSLDSQGFLFFTSETINSNENGSVNISVENISLQKEEALVRLWISVPILKTSNETAFFAIQVLNSISNVSVKINDWSCEDFGATQKILYYPSAANCSNSYILLEIPQENITASLGFYITFLWKNMLLKSSYYEYQLIVPFNAAFPSFIDDVGLPNEVINGYGKLVFEYTSETKVSIARPEGVTISNFVPNPDHYGLSYDKIWYTWELQNRCDHTTYSSTAIVVDIEIEEMRADRERTSSFSMLFFGIGIPLIIGSIIESKKDELTEAENEKEETNGNGTTDNETVEERFYSLILQRQITWGVLIFTCLTGLIGLISIRNTSNQVFFISTSIIYICLSTILSYSIYYLNRLFREVDEILSTKLYNQKMGKYLKRVRGSHVSALRDRRVTLVVSIFSFLLWLIVWFC